MKSDSYATWNFVELLLQSILKNPTFQSYLLLVSLLLFSLQLFIAIIIKLSSLDGHFPKYCLRQFVQITCLQC